MKNTIIAALLLVLSLAVPALAAQQDIAQLSAVTARRVDLRTAINTQLSAVQSNFDELYAAVGTRPWVIQATAPADTTLAWFDTNQVVDAVVLKIHNGERWVPQAIGEGGSYTLPTAAAGTLGGVKVGARLTITDGVLSADVQTGDGDGLGSAAYSDVVALWTTCTGYLKSDGTCDTPSGSATYPSAEGVANWDGSAWVTSYTVGTAANNLVQLNGSAQLPAVSGALLTGTFTGTLLGSQTTLSGAIQTIGTELDGQDELLFDSDDFTETAGTKPDGTRTVTVSIDKSAVEATQPTTLVLTTDTSITEANLLSSKYLSNYGASGEVDIILPAISYNQTRTILIEAAQVLEISPPSGEVLELSGTDLTADYCVNSGSVVGNKATVTRLRNGASTWKWSIDVVRGTWASCGAASD